MTVADNTPVIIGVRQYSERVGEPGYAEMSHMDLAGAALRAAFADARAKRSLAKSLDTIAAIRQFEISATRYTAPFGHANNTPRAIARRAGANPDRAILEVVGGQGPQRLVGELAAEIAAGRSKLAAIVGSEAISTMRALLARGETRDWSERRRGSLEDRGPGYDGVVDMTSIRHGVGAPIGGYALAENVRRERLGLSLADYRLEIGKLFAPFTRVAAANPHSAAPTERSAEELATLTDRNRLVAEPYGRLVVSRDQVNQGAAVVLASAGEARRLGVPSDRWVYVHGVADCAEPSMLTRESIEKSPAAVAAISTALELAGTSWEKLSATDLYSCFAIPVFNLLDAFGLDRDDPRGWTLTGGLPFFGGAGNNYVGHSIAEAVQRCRAQPGDKVLVGANGGIMSKYAAGVYSTEPADWSASRWQSLEKIKPHWRVLDAHDGEAVAETFTIQPGKTGETATLVARVGDARVLANSADPAICAELRKGKVFGRPVRIEEGERGVNRFWFV
ncbi:acetyl-CoA acetyltransferase [Novosphingobium sp.]|uniref:acetyl-CoA acetyltransferase n=1 Tax=Novosphingobium sp. TaxID=1874826 RepID=UPI0025EFF20A|nr:acetyl-CoA acetyltransferase [Novosphingobium sp.]MCC6924566.1 acetyl-CoA acetyltransferase [Novosphingobium sp.]